MKREGIRKKEKIELMDEILMILLLIFYGVSFTDDNKDQNH